MNATEAPDIFDALSRFDKNEISRYLKERKKPDLSHIPESKGMPILGHIYWVVKDLHQWLKDQEKALGPVFKFKALGKEFVFILGPEANRLLLQNEDNTFSNHIASRGIVRKLLDDNVLALDFAHHKSTRKALQAAFKRKAIEGHIELMNPVMRNSIESWPTNLTIPACDHIRKLLLDTGAKVFLGLDIGPEANTMNDAFVELVKGGGSFLRKENWPFTAYAKGVKARQRMDDFVYANIAKRRASTEEGRDIFSQLCNAKDDDGNYFTDEEICNQIIFILFAAHDTTSSVLSSAFYHLASDLELQEELRQEVLSLDKDHLEFDDFDKMEKIGWTMQESLRMYPPVPLYPRFAIKDFEFAGCKIPANTPVFGSGVHSHHMEEYWSNPYKFDPMRFSPERAEDKKHFFQYIPFGGGAHKCLGLHFAQVQGKMSMFYFLKNYKIEKNPDMKEFKFKHYPMTFPTDGLPLAFERL
jgi:cytochrome P450